MLEGRGRDLRGEFPLHERAARLAPLLRHGALAQERLQGARPAPAHRARAAARPVRPSSIISGMPATRVDTTGRPGGHRFHDDGGQVIAPAIRIARAGQGENARGGQETASPPPPAGPLPGTPAAPSPPRAICSRSAPSSGPAPSDVAPEWDRAAPQQARRPRSNRRSPFSRSSAPRKRSRAARRRNPRPGIRRGECRCKRARSCRAAAGNFARSQSRE